MHETTFRGQKVLRKRTRRELLVVLFALGALLSGCAQIPTNSQIYSEDIVISDPGTIYYAASGPRQGATPREIVNGFIAAQAAGLTDNFSVAREYMFANAARRWNPNADTNVYAGDIDLGYLDSSALGKPGIVPEVDLANLERIDVVVRAKSLGSVDAVGTYTESLSGAQVEAKFELALDSTGQWRISKLRDGLVMSENLFRNNYRSVSLYFLSANAQFLVPDPRWLPTAFAESSAVRALIAGPSQWLKDAVTTAIPDGTRLVAAPREGSTVTVNLSSNVRDANASQRANLAAQVQATLTRIPGVRNVDIQADSMAIDIASNESLVRDPSRATGVTSSPYVLHNDKVMQLRGKDLVPINEIASLQGYRVTALGIPERVEAGVFRSGNTEIRRLPAIAVEQEPTDPDSVEATNTLNFGSSDVGGAMTERRRNAIFSVNGRSSTDSRKTAIPVAVQQSLKIASVPRTSRDSLKKVATSVLITGKNLVAPSVDRFNWVWSAEQQQGARAANMKLSSSYGALKTEISVPWLVDRQINSIRVSPDGTRLAVVSSVNGVAHVEVVAIVRDSLNSPVSLGTPISVGGQITDATLAAWQDESALWVIGHGSSTDAASLFSVAISGPSESVAPAEDVETLTAGRGPRAVILGGADGVIRTRASSGSSWSEESSDSRFPTFPG